MVVGSTYSQKVVAPGMVEKPWALAREVLPGNDQQASAVF